MDLFFQFGRNIRQVCHILLISRSFSNLKRPVKCDWSIRHRIKLVSFVLSLNPTAKSVDATSLSNADVFCTTYGMNK